MAEKTFTNVRLGLKVDTLENWGKSTLVLKKGEVAFATVAASAGAGLSEPVVMMKIGDGEHTFSQLGFDFYAKASDVLAACKTTEGLTAFVNGVIANAGIATNSAMQELAGKVTTAEGEIDTLQSDMDAVEAKAAANETAIGTLNGLVGDKKVSIQISEAIAALNLANTYEAKGEAAKVQTALDTYKTANDAAVQKNATDIAGEITRAKAAEEANAGAISAIKDGTTIDSFADVEAALAGKETSGAAAQALADAKAYADGLADNYDANGAAATAETNAKDYADGLAKNYDAAGSAADALADANAYTDAEIAEWVGDKTVGVQISTAITNLDLANTYAAKSHKHTTSDITDFAHTHAISEVTGLQDALDGKETAGAAADALAEAKTYADGKDAAIAAAKKAGDDAQADVDALEELVGTLPADAGVATVVAYVDKKTSGIATDASLTALTNRVGTAEGKITALEGTVGDAEGGLVKDVAANAAAIADLDTLVGDTAVATQISNAVKAEEDRAKAAEKANADAITKLNADAETAGSVDYKIAQAVAGIMENPDDTINSINELVTWTNEHAEDALEMSNQVTANKNAIATLNGTGDGSVDKKIADAIAAENLSQYATDTELTGVDNRLKAVEAAVGESGSVAGDIADALAEAKKYTDDEVKELADGAVATNAADIDALQTKVGDKTVSEQISAVTNPLAERIVALEAVDHEHTNKDELDKIADGDKAKWDAKLEDVTAAADSGLKATKTGNTVAIEIDDSVTFIFDCGDAGVTVE